MIRRFPDHDFRSSEVNRLPLFSTGRRLSLASGYVPAHEHLLHRFDREEERQHQQRQNEDACEDKPGVQFAVCHQQEIAETGVGTHELSHDCADDCESACNFQATENRRQVIVSTMIGKNEIANAMRTFDMIPVPSQTMKIGAIAAFGMVWNATSI